MACAWLLTLVAALPSPAATPEALVEKLQAARKAGDFGAQLPLLGGPHRQLAAQALDVMQAAAEFDGALDDRFAKDPAVRSEFAPRPERVKRVELRGKKDLGEGRAELTLWTTLAEGEAEVLVESRVVAVRENGGWVLRAAAPFSAATSRQESRKTPDGRAFTVRVDDPPQDLTASELSAVREMLPAWRAALAKGARDVAAGKYDSRKEAVAAVDKAIVGILTVEPRQFTSPQPGKKEPTERVGADQPDEKPKKAADALQGEWVVETAGFGPMKDALKELKGQKWTIRGDRFGAPMGAGKGKLTFKVDPSKSPAEMDLYEDGQLVSRGIYALDGDKLTLCYGMTLSSYNSPAFGGKPSKVEADERPTKFDPGQGTLLVMKRAK